MAFLGAGAAIVACYIELFARSGFLWIAYTDTLMNPHLQAVLMWGFVLVAVFGLFVDRRLHGRPHAFVLGVAAFLIIVATLYVRYDERIEVIGFVTIVVAAFLNQFFIMSRMQRQIAAQAIELAELNAGLEGKVEEQVGEIGRLQRLKRFLPPKVVDMITEVDQNELLASHRRLIACLFCDVRNFTSFTESVEPEEVMDILRAFHEEAGRLVDAKGGTIAFRSGDGLMVIFNDPLPCDEPVFAAADLAFELQGVFEAIGERWRRLGHDLGFGVGIAHGYATLGLIGAEGRVDYTAIGNVVNIASRLCDMAADGQILMDRRAAIELEGKAELVDLGAVELKGVARAVEVVRAKTLTV